MIHSVSWLRETPMAPDVPWTEGVKRAGVKGPLGGGAKASFCGMRQNLVLRTDGSQKERGTHPPEIFLEVIPRPA